MGIGRVFESSAFWLGSSPCHRHAPEEGVGVYSLLMSVIMGIDPGTRVAGYGIVESSGRGDPQYVDHGTVRAPRGAPVPVRLARIFEGLEEAVLRYRPDVLAVEESFVGRNLQSAIRMGEGRGIALLVGARAGIEIHEYAAARVKKSVVGNGRADKVQVQRMVQAILRIPEVPPTDAADALAVALCHCHRIFRPLRCSQVKGRGEEEKEERLS